MYSSIDIFQKEYYILSLEKLAFNLPHVKIMGTNNCGKQQRGAFKRLIGKKYFKTRRYFSETFDTIFCNKN